MRVNYEKINLKSILVIGKSSGKIVLYNIFVTFIYGAFIPW